MYPVVDVCLVDFVVVRPSVRPFARPYGIIQRRKRQQYDWQIRLGAIYPMGLNNYSVEETNLALSYSLNTTTDLENLNNLQELLNTGTGVNQNTSILVLQYPYFKYDSESVLCF